MVLLPDDQHEFVAGAGDHVHSTPINSPPHSPEVIEIVAVDENRPQPSNRRPVTHHPPLGPAKTPSRKRPASQNPTSSKRPKVCFKKDQNSRPIILQDPAIVEAGPASRDPKMKVQICPRNLYYIRHECCHIDVNGVLCFCQKICSLSQLRIL